MTKARDLADNSAGSKPQIIAAKGDLLAGTADNVVANLSVGTNGQVLTAASGQTTGLQWATLSGAQLQEVVFTSSNATWTIPTGVTGIWALCVGAGGGGGASSSASASNSGGGGGAGQVLEKYFSISGDTTLNITVPAGGAGGTAGGKGSSGSAATIVGNTSATTYHTAAGGGGGGGGAAANITSISGASSGGGGIANATFGGGGGGMGASATAEQYGVLGSVITGVGGGGSNPTTFGVTGWSGGGANTNAHGGMGINIWGRSICGGGVGGTASTGIANSFGVGAATSLNSAGSSATANTGSGGNCAKTNATTAFSGGNGGSGLVVLRYVG
jgi:hypothetical protein